MRGTLAVLALASSMLSGCGDADPSAEPRPRAAACGPVDYDVYDAGAQVDGLAKTETVRLCEHATNEPAGAPPNAGIVNSVGTMYGTCEPPEQGEGGCSPPLQIQSTPACLKNPALHEKYPASGGITDHEKTTIRGAPAAIFRRGHIEVYTGDATITIFADSRRVAWAAAARLTGRRAGRQVAATDPLPPPVPGALEGKLRC
jgi:hypothetical protein